MFLGKFCFISEKGRIDFSISYPAKYGIINLLFYYDIEWTNIYGNTQKVSTKWHVELYSIV
jgi:hypothetical protein